MSWCHPLITQEEHAHLQRTIYLLSQWQRCFSVAALSSLLQQQGKKAKSTFHLRFHYHSNPSRASRGASFLPSLLFSVSIFEIFISDSVKESFDRFSFMKFLSALIKLGRSWHPEQTELVNAAHSWSFVSSMKSSLVPHLSYYVWGAARNANTSKPPELLWRGRFGRNSH